MSEVHLWYLLSTTMSRCVKPSRGCFEPLAIWLRPSGVPVNSWLILP